MQILEDYISRLPDGLDSYPDAQCKASVVNAFTRDYRDVLLANLAHDRLARLIAEPPLDSMWVCEVEAQAIFHVLRAVQFPTEPAFLQYARDMNQALLSSRLYRTLFRVLSHSRVSRLSATAWGRFHIGTRLTVESTKGSTHVFFMEFPPHLLEPVGLRAILTGIELALTLGGAEEVTLDDFETTATSMRVRVGWSVGRQMSAAG